MTKNYKINIGSFQIANDLPLTLIAGPCAIESRNHALEVAHSLVELTKSKNISFIYKSSFDKANRSSSQSPRGIVIKDGLEILAEVRETLGCPVITDVHDVSHCEPVGKHVDIIQIPAFLCRQTDLLIAAAATGKAINIKKGQFLAPWDMQNVVNKISETGNNNILLCERGTSFGYNTLISDMRSLPILSKTGYPVVFDATHSVQQPGGKGTSSGGEREFVPILSKAAVAIGVAAVFLETHPDPDNAPSDGPNMLNLSDLPPLIDELKAFDRIAKSNN
jgi:2-dehydro-3-deoxyphosphooctonate aldolase (KDO 8-P synthase)